MYEKLKDLFTRNLLWKAFSILMSAVLWFIVMNINNPTEIKTFHLSLDLSNLDILTSENIAVLNISELENIKIDIRLKATRPVLDELNKKVSKGEIKAYIDISTLLVSDEIVTPSEVNLQLKTDLSNVPYPNNNFEILSSSSDSVNLNLDTIITTTKKISVSKTGTEKSGYIAYEPEISPEYIQITGARSIINTISSVSVNIDISNQSSTFTQDAVPVAYDKNGDVVSDITFDVESISVKVPILSKGTVEISEPKITGNLATGYSIKSISYSPTTLNVVGNSVALKNITSINLPNLDISDLSSSKEFKFDIDDILKNSNLTANNNDVSEITVFVEIEKNSEKTITLTSDDLTVNNPDNKSITLPNTFDISISALKDTLQNISATEITASIDLTNVEDGVQSVPVNISLPENVYLVENIYINVLVGNETTSQSEEETSS